MFSMREKNKDKIRCVDKNIFIGPGNDVEKRVHALTPDELEKTTIGILNTADDYPEWEHHRNILYIHAGLNDGPVDWNAPWGLVNSDKAYTNAVQSLIFLANHCQVVYVHCHGGVSRSCFVLALYLMIVKDVTLDKAVRLIKKRYDRINIHPKHLDWLSNYNKIRRH